MSNQRKAGTKLTRQVFGNVQRHQNAKIQQLRGDVHNAYAVARDYAHRIDAALVLLDDEAPVSAVREALTTPTPVDPIHDTDHTEFELNHTRKETTP